MVIRRAVFGLAVTAVALVACQVIVGIEEVAKVQQDSLGEGGSSTSSSGGPNIKDPCKHVAPPDFDAAIEPAKDLPPFWLATQTMSLTDQTAGFDLDGTCSCDRRPDTAFKGAQSCKGAEVCDTADGGIDNNGAQLFGRFSQFGVDLNADLNEDTASGRRTIMLFVSEWNGKKYDPDVKVGVFVSNGTHKIGDNDDNREPPKFDGNDGWTWQRPVTRAGDGVTLEGKNGYVMDGKLVVKSAGDLNIYFGIAKVTFGSALIVGDLTYDEATGVKRFKGIVGGRIPRDDIFAAAGQLRSGKNEQGQDVYACHEELFAFAGGLICAGADVTASPLRDNQNQPCDAVSSAITLDAVSANILVGEEDELVIPDENDCVPGRSGRPDGYHCE